MPFYKTDLIQLGLIHSKRQYAPRTYDNCAIYLYTTYYILDYIVQKVKKKVNLSLYPTYPIPPSILLTATFSQNMHRYMLNLGEIGL